MYIDTTKGFWINGVDISPYIKENGVEYGFEGGENVQIFCASLLDQNNCIEIAENSIDLTPEFLREIKKFGEYSVVFDGESFIKSMNEALKNEKCDRDWNRVHYCTKTNHEDVHQYFTTNKYEISDSLYFLKDSTYRLQNEWRYTIEYFEDSPAMHLNADKSIDIKIPPFGVSKIVELKLL